MTTSLLLLWLLAAGAPEEPSAEASADPTAEAGPEEGEEPQTPPPEDAVPSSAALRAQQHFEAQEWDLAVEALMEAYAEDPDPAFIYARAQAERMRGKCSVAVALYRRFLEMEPSERQRADTERHIRLCEEVLFNEEADAPEPEEPPGVGAGAGVDDEPPPDRAPLEPSPPRPGRDALGLSLVVVGGSALVAGATVWGLGQRGLQRASRSPTEGGYERQAADGRQRMILGASLAGVGLAVTIGGIVRLALLARGPRTLAGPWWRPGASGIALTTRF
ncbi:MAG: hypothetical protein KC501_07985 [Myxococcales bacterium]|nr:hypothetical protein [Myxococcales bacterium]